MKTSGIGTLEKIGGKLDKGLEKLGQVTVESVSAVSTGIARESFAAFAWLIPATPSSMFGKFLFQHKMRQTLIQEAIDDGHYKPSKPNGVLFPRTDENNLVTDGIDLKVKLALEQQIQNGRKFGPKAALLQLVGDLRKY